MRNGEIIDDICKDNTATPSTGLIPGLSLHSPCRSWLTGIETSLLLAMTMTTATGDIVYSQKAETVITRPNPPLIPQPAGNACLPACLSSSIRGAKKRNQTKSPPYFLGAVPEGLITLAYLELARSPIKHILVELNLCLTHPRRDGGGWR